MIYHILILYHRYGKWRGRLTTGGKAQVVLHRFNAFRRRRA